jgi:hypothetical protein
MVSLSRGGRFVFGDREINARIKINAPMIIETLELPVKTSTTEWKSLQRVERGRGEGPILSIFATQANFPVSV